jgi:hypothetical protein
MNVNVPVVNGGTFSGALKRGETITLDNGRVVKPSDCIEPDTPGAVHTHFLSSLSLSHTSIFLILYIYFLSFCFFLIPRF